MGTIVNKAYVDRSFHAIVVIGLFTIVIFCARGAATYFQAVILSRVGNAIIAENQRKLFDRLMHQNLGFFAERHSSEFLHRLSTGAVSAMQVLNLLITAVGRDLLSLIGLATVMVIQDPVMSLSAAIIAPPAMWMIRKLVRRVKRGGESAVHRRHAAVRNHAGDRPGHPHRQGLHARRPPAQALLRQRRRGRIRSQQDGAGLEPLEPDDGSARRRRHRDRRDLWRLSHHRDERHAGRVLLLHHRVPAGLRAGEAARAPQYRAECRTDRRAPVVRHHRRAVDRSRRQQQAEARHGEGRRSNSRMSGSPIARTSRCCAGCRSSPKPAR